MNTGKKFDVGYATVSDANGGARLREIAELMTAIGFPMNHSSARNHLLRAMQKFVKGFCEAYGQEKSEAEQLQIARDPRFQESMFEIMEYLEMERRNKSHT